MSLNNCDVVFDDSPNAIFHSGQTISGKINLFLNKNKSFQALVMKVSGKAKCKWDESSGSGDIQSVTTYVGKEDYIDIEKQLSDEKSELTAGNHSFKFSFTVPSNAPSSLEENYGYIRYAMKITMRRSFKANLTYTLLFTVLSPINLSLIPDVKLPISNKTHKTFQILFFKQGPLDMTIEMPFSGYVPGQIIKLKSILKNDSNVKVDSVKIILKKKVEYISKGLFGKTIKKESKKVFSKDIEGVNCKEKKSVETFLRIPAIPSSTLGSSSVIEVYYCLEVIAVVSGMHGNLSTKIPITIGTIPITWSNIGFQPNTSVCETPTPSINYMDLPPPSYEEVMMEKKMEDDEDWGAMNSYAPKYPVYKFNE